MMSVWNIWTVLLHFLSVGTQGREPRAREIFNELMFFLTSSGPGRVVLVGTVLVGVVFGENSLKLPQDSSGVSHFFIKLFWWE